MKRAEQHLLDYTASLEFKDIQDLVWTSAEVLDVLNKFINQSKPVPSDESMQLFTDFVDKYDSDKGWNKSEFIEDYAGGSMEFIQLDIVHDYIKTLNR